MTDTRIKRRKALLFTVVCGLVFPCAAFSQVKIICPLPNAIVQKVSDSGYLRLHLTSAASRKIRLELTDSTGKEIPNYNWRELTFRNNTVDTFFTVPLLRIFSIKWQVTEGETDSGVIGNLSVGHVYGIAGQSNAQGWSNPTYIPPQGNIRMLLNDSAWQKGEDPTGGKWASPWIQFSNKLQELLKDSLPIGLVNVAVGGTGLVNKPYAGCWQRNDVLHTDSLTVYGKAIVRFLNAGSRFEAIFWIQGESDAVGVTGAQYNSTFSQLVENFKEDLRQPVRVFHLQIGGQNGNPDPYDWGVIRNAQRDLTFSTLAGTAVGSPVGFDNIHYAQITEIMVGDRFAGTIAKLIHNIPNNLYPPLLPGNSAALAECTSQDPYKGYKIVVQCSRDGIPAHLKLLDTLRGFQIRVNENFIDTSKVFAKVELNDLSKVDIFSKDSLINPRNELRVSYAITADLSNVNVGDNDSATSLPNYLISFMDVPVSTSALSSTGAFFVSQNIPNPFNDRTYFTVYLRTPQPVSYFVYDLSGKMIRSRDIGMLPEGSYTIIFLRESLVSGVYQLAFKIGMNIVPLKIVIL